ncbi:HDL416Wp [Eremothecium sinecaudum]|uniref:tRNA pseudouridine(55) synthase n=1 Tax=Eremothecium sinecaudum TaxID=45286 RepID=A0A120K239_9SACH|nr:HDL416Wp [Eremothecium sinecaudum]AMD20328.1 HDL416Wp [Eremothecium sinecaudum]
MNGIIAIEKPAGISSNKFLERLRNVWSSSKVFSDEIAIKLQQYKAETGKKPNRRKMRKVADIKLGHGGTLDPLASGVLVVGVGKGTKKLPQYLTGATKVYETVGLFGVATTSGDSEGDVLKESSVSHLNMEELKTVEEKFLGCLKQTPPIYAALKMNGKPLYEYARNGIPLPKPIEPREVNIFELKVFEDSLSREHDHKFLRPLTEEAKDTVSKLNANIADDVLYYSDKYCSAQGWDNQIAPIEKPIELTAEEREIIEKEGENYRAPTLHFKAKVSSGTYIRSLVSDIGKAMRSSAYMVELIRVEQQEWSLEKGNVFSLEDFIEHDEQVWRPVLEKVLENGGSVNVKEELQEASKKFASQVQPDIPSDSAAEPLNASEETLVQPRNESKRTLSDTE